MQDCSGKTDLPAVDLDNALGFVITETSYLMRKYLLQNLREQGRDYGVNIEELPLLARVHERPGIQQSELNQLTLKDKTTVARLLASMERKQLIHRVVDPDDRRARLVHLGGSGERLLCYLLPEVMRLREELTTGIEEEDLQLTLQTLQVLYQRLAKALS